MALLRNKKINHQNRLGGLETEPATWDRDVSQLGGEM